MRLLVELINSTIIVVEELCVLPETRGISRSQLALTVLLLLKLRDSQVGCCYELLLLLLLCKLREGTRYRMRLLNEILRGVEVD